MTDLSLSRILATFRHEVRILRRDIAPIVVLTVLPIGFMAFVKNGFQLILQGAGFENASGAEQAVPGMTVMFAFFLSGVTGWSFFREHTWGTWERLRASAARPFEIIVGKVLPAFCVLAVQMTVLFGLGHLVFGLRVRGSLFALVVVLAAYACFLVALGVALVSVCRTVQQLNTINNVGGMLLAGLGGAIVPLATLPRWARAIAPASPAYWAMRGLRSIVLDGHSPAAYLAALILLVYAACFTVLALARFRFEETKTSWS